MGETVERVNQATEKWEEDEPLGERATKAAVLYANINYPQWKQQYPEWSERVKHIHRMWRSLDANSRQEYVNKARINRANRVKVGNLVFKDIFLICFFETSPEVVRLNKNPNFLFGIR